MRRYRYVKCKTKIISCRPQLSDTYVSGNVHVFGIITSIYLCLYSLTYYRIIQMYVMKEEAGALSSDMMDRNKVCV